jgi:hypothetical protein
MAIEAVRAEEKMELPDPHYRCCRAAPHRVWRFAPGHLGPRPAHASARSESVSRNKLPLATVFVPALPYPLDPPSTLLMRRPKGDERCQISFMAPMAMASCKRGASPRAGHWGTPGARAARRVGGLDSDRRICGPCPRDWQGGQDRSGRTDLPAL